jgi:hypothetical protein
MEGGRIGQRKEGSEGGKRVRRKAEREEERGQTKE